MVIPRRTGRKDSPAFNAIIDATEWVIREEGYGAATSRRIADKAGVKQQLVYYYFRSMEELLLETFKKRTAKALVQLEELVQARSPIQAIWNNFVTRVDAKLVFEFLALSNRHSGIRDEIRHFVVKSRRIEAGAIARQIDQLGLKTGLITPASISFIMFCVSLIMRREAATGITEGHKDVSVLIEWALKQVGQDGAE